MVSLRSSTSVTVDLNNGGRDLMSPEDKVWLGLVGWKAVCAHRGNLALRSSISSTASKTNFKRAVKLTQNFTPSLGPE